MTRPKAQGPARKSRKRPSAEVPEQLLEAAPQPTPAPKRAARRAKSSKADAHKPGLRLSRTTLAAALAAVVLGALLIGFAAFVLLPGPGNGRLVELEWSADTGAAEAARILTDAGLLNSPLRFRLYASLAGGVQSVKPGVHLLSDDMSPRTLLRRLRRTPGGASVRVVVPEGYNKFEIARRLHDSGVCASRALLASASDPALLSELRLGANDAEGYLFPATYEFLRNADPDEVVRRMALESDRRYARLFEQHAAGFADLKATLGFSRHQVIVLASIVEKEAAVDEERPLIASVFLNRLRDPQTRPERRKLQSDPTARYGCLLRKLPSCDSPDGRATPAMVHDPANPYSTYAFPGLTPGPIASPGERAVQAVLAPAQTRYLFFVSKGNGRHTFSETFEEHNAAVRGKR